MLGKWTTFQFSLIYVFIDIWRIEMKSEIFNKNAKLLFFNKHFDTKKTFQLHVFLSIIEITQFLFETYIEFIE